VFPPQGEGKYGDGHHTVEDVVRLLRQVIGLEDAWP
jgi:hypothetical protein